MSAKEGSNEPQDRNKGTETEGEGQGGMGLDASRDVCRWAHTDSRVKRGWRGGLWFEGPTSAHITLLYGGMGAVMGPTFHLSSAAFCFSLFLWTLEQTMVSHVCRERERAGKVRGNYWVDPKATTVVFSFFPLLTLISLTWLAWGWESGSRLYHQPCDPPGPLLPHAPFTSHSAPPPADKTSFLSSDSSPTLRINKRGVVFFPWFQIVEAGWWDHALCTIVGVEFPGCESLGSPFLWLGPFCPGSLDVGAHGGPLGKRHFRGAQSPHSAEFRGAQDWTQPLESSGPCPWNHHHHMQPIYSLTFTPFFPFIYPFLLNKKKIIILTILLSSRLGFHKSYLKSKPFKLILSNLHLTFRKAYQGGKLKRESQGKN